MEHNGGVKHDPIISMRNVCKTYISVHKTNEVVRDVSLDVAENEFVVLFGPGQCGKTTMINLIAGLQLPTSGEVVVDGKKVTAPGPDRGVVYQTTALFPFCTVMGNVEFGPKSRGVDKKARRERAEYFIKLVGLEGFEKSFPNQLSGGMRQRVGIARAYANDPHPHQAGNQGRPAPPAPVQRPRVPGHSPPDRRDLRRYPVRRHP